MNDFNKLSSDILRKNYLNTCISSIEEFPYCRILGEFSAKCNTITEINSVQVKDKLTFTWCMLYGLLDNNLQSPLKKFTSLSFKSIEKQTKYAREVSKYTDIDFSIEVNKEDKKISSVSDMIFIHTDFNYQFLEDILVENCDMATKYIIIYDNKFVDMIKKNVFSIGNSLNTMKIQETITKFLIENNTWGLIKGYDTEYGMTILQRVKEV